MTKAHKAFNTLYTGMGDTGDTQVIGGWSRKNSPMVNSYGEVDELNSHVGLLRAFVKDSDYPQEIDAELWLIQNWLFDLGTDLSNNVKSPIYRLEESTVGLLENYIDRYTEEVEPINYFVLPAGNLPASQSHVCRTVTRRAERAMYDRDMSHAYIGFKFINRLSDYFFSLARYLNALHDIEESKYDNDKKVYQSSHNSSTNNSV